ncbi:MAG: FAD-binding oxidoreductase [Wenzhouxiangellaceae bacterium]|nr:FAD-binding oxidoreductase [Wenzhouxiangellaceae bacterium]
MSDERVATLAGRLADRLGDACVVQSGDIPERFLEEPRGRFARRPDLLARPGSTGDTAAVIRQCRAAGMPVVARGGGTGLVGGASVAAPSIAHRGGGVLLSLDRMDRIVSVDADAAAITLEAGATLAAAADAAAEYGMAVPLSLASGGSATIGGIVATNAGGNTTIRHGNARRMVLGLEAVLADGRVLDLMSTLRKDNAGYALGQLLIGSEGTLGIITRAVLALVAQSRQQAAAWCAVDSPRAALRLLRRVRSGLGETLTAFELISRRALEFSLVHLPGSRDPLAEPSPWYVLVEAGSAIAGDWLEGALLGVLEAAAEAGTVENAALAANRAQAAEFWRLREAISPAQKPFGASVKHDISIPTESIPHFIDEACIRLEQRLPGIRPCIFGHAGDGNLHFNLTRPEAMSDEAFMALEPELNRIVFDLVVRSRGSIAAEHGIGQLRIAELARRTDPVKLDVLRRIKHALDPDNLLNPGKVIVPDAKT